MQKKKKPAEALGYFLLRVSGSLRLKEDRPDSSQENFKLSQPPDVVIT